MFLRNLRGREMEIPEAILNKNRGKQGVRADENIIGGR